METGLLCTRITAISLMRHLLTLTPALAAVLRVRP
jgi:hypothetical protein